MQLQVKLSTINRMFARRMEVKLYPASCKVIIIQLGIQEQERCSSSCLEIFPVIESHLVRCASPDIFVDLVHILLVGMFIRSILKLHLFEVGVVRWTSIKRNGRLFFAFCRHFPVSPVCSVVFVVKRLEFLVLIIVSIFSVRHPCKRPDTFSIESR